MSKAHSPELVEAILRAVLDGGESYAEIGERIGGGLTRSSISGIVSRARERGQAPPKAQPTTKAQPMTKARRAFVAVQVEYSSAKSSLTITDLSNAQCRWPVTPHDARIADIRFCGTETGTVHRPMSPYCPAHHALAYTPYVPRNRRAT